MEYFIIDTNFFINLEIQSGFGRNAAEIVQNFTQLAGAAKQAKNAEFFMPARIMEELTGFLAGEAVLTDLQKVITVKSPEISQLQFPAGVFYQLVEETRERAYRGLRTAESAATQAARQMMGKADLSKIDFEQSIGEIIKTLREKYRQATRFNFLDSVADLDLIALTKELDGFLVSSDEGVIRWGRIFGVKEMASRFLKERLTALAEFSNKTPVISHDICDS